MRCSRCGNENPGLNRFCGMCGSTLLEPAAPAASVPPSKPGEPANPYPSRVAGGSTMPSIPTPPRPPEPVSTRVEEPDSQPVISGPSFLGLNQPVPARPAASGLGPYSERSSESSARSLDYLLEEEEPEPQGRGKFVLVMIALALALGLGYLRWRNEGLDWLTSGIKKTLGSSSSDSASQPPANGNADNSTAANPGSTSNGTPANAPPAAPANGTAQPDVQPVPASGGAPGNPAAANPAPGGREVVPVDSDSGAKSPADAGANSSAAKGAPANPAPANADSTDSSDDGSQVAAPAAAASTKSSAKNKANDEDADSSDDEDSAPAAKPAPALTKPHAAKPLDAVADGEKYIYGRGVVQDCDRGVKMIRQAANQSNAKAMISLGALYSAGLCTPRDLPTAYRWFAIALRREPDNNSVQTDLQKLWSEMTPPERQLAIKLSQ